MGRTRLFYGGRQQQKQNKTKQLIDFIGYPSPQLELELSWQVGAKVDQNQICDQPCYNNNKYISHVVTKLMGELPLQHSEQT